MTDNFSFPVVSEVPNPIGVTPENTAMVWVTKSRQAQPSSDSPEIIWLLRTSHDPPSGRKSGNDDRVPSFVIRLREHTGIL